MKTFFTSLLTTFFIIASLQSAPKQILVGSPIRQKPAILKEFLESLDHLERNTYTLDFCFVDDNLDEESIALIEAFSKKYGDRCEILQPDEFPQAEGYLCDETTHHWTQEIMWKVAAFKDRIIEIAKAKKYDYLFLADSDLVLHPFTIDQLILADKEIVSNVFWTVWTPNTPSYPQVWLQDANSHYRREPGEVLSQSEIYFRSLRFVEELKHPGIFEVGGLGACTLISRSALLKGVSFQRIKNLNFHGEDRHFCIRAAALKIPLFLDTHLPAYHIYRESNLDGVAAYKKLCGTKITLSMIVKNEANRYLKEVLNAAKPYISNAVIIDDASTDNTAEVCQEILQGIPLKLVKNEETKFDTEHFLRKQQWEETVATNPDWILVLDADEIFEDCFAEKVQELIRSPYVDLYCFRLYDFWDKDHYREDSLWNAHLRYHPFLVRFKENINYFWRETNQHCGRLPLNVETFEKKANSPLRIKHFGWAKPEDRMAKYLRYLKLDPNSQNQFHAQYQSILDPNPHLIAWNEG